MNRKAFLASPIKPEQGICPVFQFRNILENHFGFSCVGVYSEMLTETDLHLPGAKDIEWVEVNIMEKTIRQTDLLFTHEDYSQKFWGASLNCISLMYVREFAIMGVMDAYYDRYISVSGTVSDFIKKRYGIISNIIPPSLIIPESIPLENRSAGKVLLLGNLHFFHLIDLFKSVIKEDFPDFQKVFHIGNIISGMAKPSELLQYRYIVWLTPNEGFPFPVMQAMACGCTVISIYQSSGETWMKKGINCETIPYPNYKEMGQKLLYLMKNPEQAKRLADAALAEAIEFSKKDFRNQWIQVIEELLAQKKRPAWDRAKTDFTKQNE